ncbi:MAG: PAS domain S-box protein [Leptodesmis sp.]
MATHTIWTITTPSPVRNEQGEIYRIVGTSIDITDRKQTELALQQQILREQLIADISHDIRQSLELNKVLSRTVELIRELLNTDRVIIFRLRSEWQGDVIMESVGANWISILSTTIADPCFRDRYIESYRLGRVGILHNIDQADLDLCYADLLKQFQVKANLVVPILQGEQLWGLLAVQHCSAPWQWQTAEIDLLQQLATQVGIAIQQSELYQQTRLDLLERERMQSVLEESEERFRILSSREQAALLDIASDAIFVRDLDHQILYWNQGAEQLYGWSATEAIGQQASDLLQEPTPQIAEIVQTLLDQGEWRGEIHKTTKAGKEVIVDAHWTLVRDEVGPPRSILAVSTDITERKQIEAQFYQAQRLESLGTLASGIAHDLNNVLTPILAIAQLLRLKPLNLDARSQEMLRVLEDSAKRGANMIKQILTFTRSTGEKRVPLQVAPLLLEVIQVVQQTFPKTITVRDNIPNPFCGLVSADPTHLYQVLMNLCVNARDAMPNGGTLTLSVENYFVDAVFAQMNLHAQVGNYVLITIADTGIGIPAELRDRIFEPFFTTKEPGKGTGLGLSTVLGIVKDYGGFVQVSSEVGQGSQFKVYLPAIEGATEELVQSEELLGGHGELVLIVDDDMAVQRANQSLLEHHQYTTLVASDGIEATALYTKYQDEVKVVLIDVMMPNMDGVTTVRILQKINPQVKIIAISGLSTNRETILAAGANVFLLKPYTLEDLLQSLRDLIGSDRALH